MNRVLRTCVVIGLCGVLGCGGAKPVGPAMNSSVSGSVTSKGGEKVVNARISFESPTLGAYGQELTADGKYSVKMAAGEYKVMVTPVAGTNSMSISPDGKIATPTRDDIPEAYRSSSTTPAKFTAPSGSGTYDLKLE